MSSNRPRRVLPISIFLSSPLDVWEERAGIKDRIALLQKNRNVSSEFRLDLYAYEDDVPPIAGEPPQLSVDKYLIEPADVDILICMLWSRIGSPFTHPKTGKTYPSGTVYEFQAAYERYRLTGRQPIILFYQCVRPTQNDSQELERVQAFVRQMTAPGGYQAVFQHRTFHAPSELFAFIDRDLPKVLLQLTQVPSGPEDRTPRSRLIQKVRSIWIDGFLESSFDTTPPLPVAYRYEAVQPEPYSDPEGFAFSEFASPQPEPEASEPRDRGPSRNPVASDSQSGREAPEVENALTGLSLKGHFHKSDGRVLLVAPAGAGKSIALVQLLAYLLDEAARDKAAKIPMIFDLSAWTGEINIRRWILEELDRLYLVGRSAAKRLVDNNELIYLFDGIEGLIDTADLTLDTAVPTAAAPSSTSAPVSTSVSRTLRSPNECLEAIDGFRQYIAGSTATGVSICVAARPESVTGSDVERICRSVFRGHVTLRTLAQEDVARYIDSEPELEGLSRALSADPYLKRLSVTPLFLHLMMIAYREETFAVIRAVQAEAQRIPDMLGRYCDKRLRSDVATAEGDRFSLKETRRALSWIAGRQNRSLFLMELMQPSTLGEPQQPLFRNLTSVALALVLATICSVPCGVATWLEWAAIPPVGAAFRRGLSVFFATELVAFAFGLLAFRFLRGWKAGLLLGLGFGIVRGIVVSQGAPDSPLPGSLREGVIQGAFTVLVAAAYFSICLHAMQYQVDRVVPLRTFSIKLRRGLYGLLLGLGVGGAFWIFLGAARGISFGVAAALISSLLFSLNFAGIYIPVSPNQGIVRSFQTASLIGALSLLVAFVAVAGSYGVVTDDFGEGIENGIRGMASGVSWLMFGGIPVVQHYVLRILAKAYYDVPLQLTAFLRFARKLHLLQQIGGAFAFRHELVRRYFLLVK